MNLSPTILMAIVSLALWLPRNNANAADGTPVWTNYFNGTGVDWMAATGIVLDDSGNVFVTGYSLNGGHAK